jgi:hypothetical protein
MAVTLKQLKRPGKGTPPSPVETSNNLLKVQKGSTVPLQLNIDPDIKREIRVYAAERDMDMSGLLVAAWQYYKENHG